MARWTALGLSAFASALVFAGAASADPGAPFATFNGTIPAGYVEYFTAPIVASVHNSVIFRVTEAGGSANVGVEDPGSGSVDGSASGLAPDDVFWGDAGVSYEPGNAPEIQVDNGGGSTDVSFSVEFFDEPSAPIAFSGASSEPTSNHSIFPDDTMLDFNVPSSAPYQATVSLSGGAIQIAGGNTPPQTLDSSQSYPLGELNAGQNEIRVDPVDGPPAQWTISIAPAPITVFGVDFGVKKAAPGAVEALSYSVDGSTAVDIDITNASNQTVRALATNLGVSPGGHQIAWDGRDAHGRYAPDGIYTATVASKDPVGNRSTSKTTITLQRPVTPLIRAAYESFLVDAHNGPIGKACRLLTKGLQKSLARRGHAKSCFNAIRKNNRDTRGDDRYRHKPTAWRKLVASFANRLRVRQTSLHGATATDAYGDRLLLTETHNTWVFSKGTPSIDV